MAVYEHIPSRAIREADALTTADFAVDRGADLFLFTAFSKRAEEHLSAYGLPRFLGVYLAPASSARHVLDELIAADLVGRPQ
jgi:predicted Fe-Mo cluster-binding NifX family protein